MSPHIALERAPVLAVPLALLGAALVSDVRARRIPNWSTAALAVSALAFAGSRGGAAGLFESIAGMAAGLALLILPFAAGWMGAGDVKLAAAAGGWLGPIGAAWMVLGASVLGGVLSTVVLLFAPAGERLQVMHNIARLLRAGGEGRALSLGGSGASRGVPYGVGIAICAAVLVVLRVARP